MVKAVPVIPDYTLSSVPKNYYVRENKDDINLSPALNFTVALDYARKFSMDNDSGLAEIITLELEVVVLFRRGKMLLTGPVAAYVSKNGLPPAP